MDPLIIEAILHPTDFSETDFGAIAHALKIALAARGRLTYLHVGPKGTEVDWSEFPQTRKILADWGVIPENAGHDDVLRVGLSVRKSLRKGDDIVAEIGGEIRKGGADIIVLATHQRQGIARWLKKPLAETIAREIRRPTLFVPRQIEGFVNQETGHAHLQNILIPVTEAPDPTAAIEAAVGLALVVATGPVTLTLLHVGDEADQPELELPKLRAGWKFERVSRDGAVVDAILDESEEIPADLIAMTTVGREGFLDALRGTTTEQVLRGAKCPLLAVPA